MQATHRFDTRLAIFSAASVAITLFMATSAYSAEPSLAIQTAIELRASAAERAALGDAARRVLAASAKEEHVRSLLEKGSVDHLPPHTLVAWMEHAARVGEEGLPADPILSRYVEGLAKQIPLERIEAAVGELEKRLREAGTLVDRIAPADLQSADRLAAIDHTAYVLGLGADRQDVERSLTLARGETEPLDAAQASVLTFGMLIACGLPSETSLDVVSTAWQKGYRGDSLEKLGKALGEANPAGGAPPLQLVGEVMALLDQESSQDRFFEGLDELMDREGYRVPSIRIEDDPLNRREGGRLKDPIRTPDNERPAIGG